MTANIFYDQDSAHVEKVINAKIEQERQQLLSEGFTQNDPIVTELAKRSIIHRIKDSVNIMRKKGFATGPYIIKEDSQCMI